MLEEDAMHVDTEADVSAFLLDINGKKTPLKWLLDTGDALSGISIETWKQMAFDIYDLIDFRIRPSAANKRAPKVLARTPIITLNSGNPIRG